MKDFSVVYRPQLDSYIYYLWKTPEFKAAHKNPDSLVSYIVGHVCKLPRFFYTPTEDIEHGHFTTWFNCIALRDGYANPYIHDLYLLHEYAHLSHYVPSLCGAPDSFEAWLERMISGEIYASLISEAHIYTFMEREGTPIRDKTFPHRIWADNYLSGIDDYLTRHGLSLTPAGCVHTLTHMLADRVTDMHGVGVDRSATPDDGHDWCRLQISRYGTQNREWGNIWVDSWNAIEQMMYHFTELCYVTQFRCYDDRMVNPRPTPSHVAKVDPAERDAVLYLMSALSTHNTEGVLFRDEAAAFDAIKKRFDSDYGSLNRADSAILA